MLFRSDFLKKGDIPSDIERRQQTLSKVAGEVWNAMRTEEKNKWHEKAAEHLLLHQKMYPDYKFTPARRGAARARASARPNDAETKARIRELRETYTSVHGPAVSPPRRRKARARRAKIESDSEKEMEDDQPRDPGWQHLATSYIPHSLASSEPSSRNQSPLPPCFPSRSEPHISSMRRPSTSLGFVPRPDYSNANESVRYGHGLTRPSSVESSPVKFSKLMADPDKVGTIQVFKVLCFLILPPPQTPTAATFQHIAMSPQAQKFSNDGTPHAFIDTSSIFDLDAALPEAVYFNSQNLFSSQSSSHDSSPQASGPCANASQAQFQAQGWDDPNILETFWSSPAYPVFPMEGLQSDFSEHWCKLVGWDNLALPHAQGNEMSTTY